ncbi:MuDR family transposase [Cucumis melo var. makuwa]|uniref:MuDR family transposase n=1 Tax=Cucumis melo var. makuwa TaxID=1194695 RepID=A0A5A7VDD7_CUCMM|nr:MuDR family transposase [Cucumis melo var. makuwa]
MSSTFELKEKDMFASKELLSKSFYYIAINNNFELKTVRSNSKSIEFKCSQDNCPWYVYASRYKGGKSWRLRKYIANHDCSINVIQTTHRQASSSLISDCMIKDFSSFDRWTPNDIMIHMRPKLGVSVSYNKAWREKELVMNSLNGEAKELSSNQV